MFLSGKEYDVVSSAAQEPNATVFGPSASGTKIGTHLHSYI